jgi:hypothetical protein
VISNWITAVSASPYSTAGKREDPVGKKTDAVIPAERVEQSIYLIRGQKVILDRDLAALYGVPTKALKQAVQRNARRFPEDFMFILAPAEFATLRSQIVTSKRR